MIYLAGPRDLMSAWVDVKTTTRTFIVKMIKVNLLLL